MKTIEEKQLEQLKENYRGIRVPDPIATRIEAEAQSAAPTSAIHGWRYAMALALLILGVLVLLPNEGEISQREPTARLPDSRSTITLAAVAQSLPEKPIAIPGFTTLKSYQAPAVPGAFRLHSIPKS